MRDEPRFVLLVVVALLGGCAEGASTDGGNSVERRDSAGVELITTHEVTWRGAGEWAVSDEPSIDWGGLDAPEELEFENLASVLVLADGSVVVVDQGASRISKFRPDGSLVAAYGRKGEGPNEFSGALIVRRAPADSLLVFDVSLMRVTLLSPRLSPVFMRRIEAVGAARPREVHSFVEGDLLVVAAQTIGGALRQSEETYVRPPLHLLRTSRVEGGLEEIGQVTGNEAFATRVRERTLISLPMLPRLASVAVAPTGEIFTGTGDRFEISVLNPGGELIRSIRHPARERPIPPEELESIRVGLFELVEDQPSMREFAEAYLDQSPTPDLWPSFAGLLLDSEGYLWLPPYRSSSPAYPDADEEIVVVDPEGVVLGGVTIPGRFNVTDVGRDFVAGWALDDLDIPHVRVYDLRK